MEKPRGLAEHFRVKSAGLVIMAVLVVNGSIFASLSTQSDEESFSEVVEWVLQTGKHTVIRDKIADAFRLGSVDLAVKERGFRASGAKYTEVIAVAPVLFLSKRFVFLAQIDENDGSCVVWLTSPTGRIEATVVGEPNAQSGLQISRRADADHQAEFAALKATITRRWRSERSTSPAQM